MSAQKPSIAKSFVQQISTIVTIAVLGTLFYVGHSTHWQFSSLHASEAADSKVAGGSEVDAAKAEGAVLNLQSSDALQKAGIAVGEAKNQPAAQFITANGVVGYDQNKVAQLSAKVPGTVWRVEKKVGHPVKRGDVLAIIESPDVGKAKAEFLTAIASVEIRTQLLEILNPLSSVVAARQIKEAEANLREARIQLYNTHQTLVNLGLPISLDAVKGLPEDELAKRVQFLGLPPAIATTLDVDTTTANLLPLVAPFDGIVLGRDVVVGEIVTPTQAQFVVADIEKVWITLDVQVADADKISVGQLVLYKPDGLDRTVECRVTWISTDVDEKTRTIAVRCDAENPILDLDDPGSDAPRRLLHARSYGTGRIRVMAKDSATVVPNAALQWFGEKPVVFVRRADDTFVQREVELGIRGDEFTEIVQGVDPGDEIATQGSHVLKSELVRRRQLM